MISLEERIVELAEAILDDEWGINENAYNVLSDLSALFPALNDVLDQVDGTDGRFYLPQEG